MIMTMRITGMSSPDGKTTGTDKIALITVLTKIGTETLKMIEDHTRVVKAAVAAKVAKAVEVVEVDLPTESLNGKEIGTTTGLTTGKRIGIVPLSKMQKKIS